MAEQYDPGLLPRTYFRAPRVPFDFRALALGILAFLIYWLGGELLNAIFRPGNLGENDIYDLPGAFLAWGLELFNHIPHIGREIERLLTGALRVRVADASGYSWWELGIGAIWFLGIWSFFALGIHRITTMRIARDEGLSLTEALKFSIRNWPTLLLAPVIVAGVIAIFYGCNALAGLAMSIPFVGGILGLILAPLAVISTLLIVLVGVGGIFGLPLISAAAAWECNGSLDAISRAFSYLFARPLQYFWNFFLIFLFTGLILLVGTWFTFTFAKSMDAGGMSDVMTVMLDPPAFEPRDGTDYSELSTEAQTIYKDLDLNDIRRARRPGDTLYPPPAMDLRSISHVPWGYKLNVLILWLFLNLIWFGVSGYALYWLIGAASSVYADLRADVDGTEEDEVFLEEEELDLEALAEDGPATEGAAADTPGGPAAAAPAPQAPSTDAPADESPTDGDDGKPTDA